MGYNRVDELFYMQGLEIRAAKRVYKAFYVTRYELHLLASLSSYLQMNGKQVVSKELFFDWIGTSRVFNERSWLFIESLIKKGCLHRLTWRNKAPGTGASLCISPFGLRVLEHFYSECDKLERSERGRKKKLSIKDLIVNSDNIPKGYTLRQAGRND